MMNAMCYLQKYEKCPLGIKHLNLKGSKHYNAKLISILMYFGIKEQ